MPAWLVCDGQSSTLLSKVYQLSCFNLVNDSEPFVKISVEEYLVSFLLCTLHSGNDLEDVRFGCTGWSSLTVIKSGRPIRGSSAVESVAPYLLTVLPTVDLWILKRL